MNTTPSGKFCIFCGQKPEKKNREHIIPRWLIKMTGKESRKVFLGLDWASETLDAREFSWGSFTFPACEECNSRWSDIEGEIKTIISKMNDKDSLSSTDLQLLFNWIDKLRVGLWLGFYYLNKNYRGIVPQFFIDSRVARQDRALFIFETIEETSGIGLYGCDSPIFHMMPSLLHISINSYHFVSVSTAFLLSNKLGWPTLKNKFIKSFDDDQISLDLVPSDNSFSEKLFANAPKLSGVLLSQPIAPPEAMQNEEYKKLYEVDHVRAMSDGQKLGVGKIFLGNSNPSAYSDDPSKSWIPRVRYPFLELVRELSIFCHTTQCSLFEDSGDYSNFSQEEQQSRTRHIESTLKLQNVIFNHHFSQLLGKIDEQHKSPKLPFS